jgi:hypothetical protein
MWLASLSLSATTLSATLQPYDPTGKYVLGNPSKMHRIAPLEIASDAAAVAVKQALFAVLAALAGKTAAVVGAIITQADPLGAVVLRAYFADRTSYAVPDVYGLAATNPAWSAAVAGLLSYLATK